MHACMAERQATRDDIISRRIKTLQGYRSDPAPAHACAQRQVVHLDGDRPGIPYDALSLDVGITPSAAGVPGALQHATPVKPVSKCAFITVPVCTVRQTVHGACIALLHPSMESRQAPQRIANSFVGHACHAPPHFMHQGLSSCCACSFVDRFEQLLQRALSQNRDITVGYAAHLFGNT